MQCVYCVRITLSIKKKDLKESFCFIFSAIAPYTIGAIFSWSLTNIKGNSVNQNPLGFPFDQHLAFFVMSTVTLLVIPVVCFVNNVDMENNESDKMSSEETLRNSSNIISEFDDDDDDYKSGDDDDKRGDDDDIKRGD